MAAKINNIDTSDFVLETKYKTEKTALEKKILDTIGLVKNTDDNTEITEIENKIPGMSNLATKPALITVENKILNLNGLAEKTNYNTKLTEIKIKLTDHNHDKYVTTPEFNT